MSSLSLVRGLRGKSGRWWNSAFVRVFIAEHCSGDWMIFYARCEGANIDMASWAMSTRNIRFTRCRAGTTRCSG